MLAKQGADNRNAGCIMDFQLNNNNIPVVYVNTPALLTECAALLRHEKTIAFDLEFDRNRYKYGFNLCLLQIATEKKCFVIDPVSPINLEPVFEVFEDPAVQKVVHCPGEDLKLLHTLRCYPKNVFDTEITAKLLNYEATSLSAMLQQKLDVTLNKKQQKSNWNNRPLSFDQILYSSNDVIYLHRLQELLLAEATDKGIANFLPDEFLLLETEIYGGDEKDSYLSALDLKALSPFKQYVLNEVYKFREDLGKHYNKPSAQLIETELLRDIALDKISLDVWADNKGVYRALKTDAFQRQFENTLAQIKASAEALQLSRKKAPYDAEAERQKRWQEREEMEIMRQQTFTPIQTAIAARYGEFAQRCILSTSAVNEILKKRLTIGTIKQAYRQTIIEAMAAETGADLTDYR